MSYFQQFGLKEIINADRKVTALGGSAVNSVVAKAPQDAAMEFVDVAELMVEAGKVIAFGASIKQMIGIGGGKVIEVGQTNYVEKQHIAEAVSENTAAFFYQAAMQPSAHGSVPPARNLAHLG
jgi:seryl-tRNA(Sec) selenium transferase